MRVSLHYIQVERFNVDEDMLAKAIRIAYQFGQTSQLPTLFVEQTDTGKYKIVGDIIPYLVAHITNQALIRIEIVNGNQNIEPEDGRNLPGPVIQLPRIDPTPHGPISSFGHQD